LDTQKRKSVITRFIVLIPHRDALGSFDEYRGKLFAAGFSGAFAFPIAAPLATVSRSFSREELKILARNIRNLTTEKDGRIQGRGTAFVHCPCSTAGASTESRQFSFFGVMLDFPINEELFPQMAKGKILQIAGNCASNSELYPILCAAMVHSARNSGGENAVCEESPALSFRAASLANLAIRPLGAGELDYSFEWKMGPRVWLGKYKGEGRR